MESPTGQGNGQVDFPAVFQLCVSLTHISSVQIWPACLSFLNSTNVGFGKSSYTLLKYSLRKCMWIYCWTTHKGKDDDNCRRPAFYRIVDFAHSSFKHHLAMYCGMWDLSSPTRDWTHVCCIGNMVSSPLAHWEGAPCGFYSTHYFTLQFYMSLKVGSMDW